MIKHGELTIVRGLARLPPIFQAFVFYTVLLKQVVVFEKSYTLRARFPLSLV